MERIRKEAKEGREVIEEGSEVEEEVIVTGLADLEGISERVIEDLIEERTGTRKEEISEEMIGERIEDLIEEITETRKEESLVVIERTEEITGITEITEITEDQEEMRIGTIEDLILTEDTMMTREEDLEKIEEMIEARETTDPEVIVKNMEMKIEEVEIETSEAITEDLEIMKIIDSIETEMVEDINCIESCYDV